MTGWGGLSYMPVSKCQKDVKLSKKMSNVKNSNTWTIEEVHKKNYIMRFTDIDINFDIKYEHHQNWSKYILCTFWGFLVTARELGHIWYPSKQGSHMALCRAVQCYYHHRFTWQNLHHIWVIFSNSTKGMVKIKIYITFTPHHGEKSDFHHAKVKSPIFTTPW